MTSALLLAAAAAELSFPPPIAVSFSRQDGGASHPVGHTEEYETRNNKSEIQVVLPGRARRLGRLGTSLNYD